MGKPAARLGDNHVCPKVTSKVPHVGGPAAAGSPNVFINGMPAARQGDMMVCIGPPDSIKGGSASVFINGKPAARMGDTTEHGGIIISGSGNVFIGDKAGASAGQTKTLSSSAPFCEECEACKDGECAI
ncbi:PAAR domain-containing protein [Photobacterium nomapromontoriensis]|uniref:PAAR domain-containing protein n=1 Tax=Photobacterium nomapromontoriensis TaxID=2910237 RepID=UPI003D0CE388